MFSVQNQLTLPCAANLALLLSIFMHKGRLSEVLFSTYANGRTDGTSTVLVRVGSEL